MYRHICTENALRQPAHTEHSAAWMQEWKSESACLAFWFWLGNCSHPDLAVGNQRGDLPLLIIFRSDGCSSHIHFRTTTKKQEILSEPPPLADARCPLCLLNKGLVLTKPLKKHHLFWSSGPWNCTSELCVSDLGVEGITCFVSHRPTRVFVSSRYERFLRLFFPPTTRTFPCCDKPDQAGDPVALPSLPVPSCDRLSWY